MGGAFALQTQIHTNAYNERKADMTSQIYIAGNDLTTKQITQPHLQREGYNVQCFDTNDQLYSAFAQTPCALAILNTYTSGKSGFIVGAMLRQLSDIPIIILAAEDCDDDYIFCISLGLDAYLAKPICQTKLVAHVRALITKTGRYQSAPQPQLMPSKLTYADLSLCHSKIMAYCNDMALKLTGTEFRLLAFLLENQDRAILRNEFLSKIWGEKHSIGIRAVDDVIKRLRKKLMLAASCVSIDTVWGHGFRLSVRG